jgi:3-dehydroquinate dehydratase/shikimate dehydrogenase
LGELTGRRSLLDRRRLIAIALGDVSTYEALEFLERGAAGADIVEIRVDLFRDDVDVAALVRSSSCPLIVTNRPTREGGRCTLDEVTRMATLCAAAEAGAALVDVEWDAATPAVVRRLRGAGAAVIVSRHAFDRMPVEIEQWVRDIEATEADVVKVVGVAQQASDVRSILRVVERASAPTIAIAMGSLGRASRVLALRYDACFLTFAAPPSKQWTAPGQIDIDTITRVYHVRTIESEYRAYVVAGPVVSDEVMQMVNWRLGATCQKVFAVPIETNEPMSSVVAALCDLPIDGWCFTEAIPLHDLDRVIQRIGPSAFRNGEANAIVREGNVHTAELIQPGLDNLARFWTAPSSRIGPTRVPTNRRRV